MSLVIKDQSGVAKLVLLAIASVIVAITVTWIRYAQVREHAGEKETASSFGDPPGIPVRQLEAAPNSVGNISGIKYSIPHNYLLSGVQYEGEEPMFGPMRKIKPTFRTNIIEFSILLRLSTLQPIKSEQDLRDWERIQDEPKQPYLYEVWTTIGIEPMNAFMVKTRLKYLVDLWMNNDTRRGPYIQQKQRDFDLVHMISEKKIDESDSASRQYDFYFDDKEWMTFIYCETGRKQVPPFNTFNTCHINFIDPELKTFIYVDLTRKDLSRWQEIERTVEGTLNSFVVN